MLATVAPDRTLAALADPVRRRAVELLAVRTYRAGELAQALGVPPPTMSKHLRVLRQQGIVSEQSPEFHTRVRSTRCGCVSGPWAADD